MCLFRSLFGAPESRFQRKMKLICWAAVSNVLSLCCKCIHGVSALRSGSEARSFLVSYLMGPWMLLGSAFHSTLSRTLQHLCSSVHAGAPSRKCAIVNIRRRKGGRLNQGAGVVLVPRAELPSQDHRNTTTPPPPATGIPRPPPPPPNLCPTLKGGGGVVVFPWP